MFYSQMMTREHLIRNAVPALKPLFEAYAVERQRGADWRKEIEKSLEFPQMKEQFDKFQNVGLFAIAQCVALIADNISRVYCKVKLNDEDARTQFGDTVVNGFPFGRLLWPAGNVARHYANAPVWALRKRL